MIKHMSTSLAQEYPVKTSIGIKIFFVLCSLVTFASLLFYIYQANAMIREKYLVQGYQKKLNTLSRENMALELDLSQVNSPLSLRDLVSGLNFEKIDNVRYIKVLESQVLAR